MPHSSQEAPGRVLLGDFGAASCYERADEVLAGRLERLEVRAFGCLLAELLARCDGGDADLDPLHRLAGECGWGAFPATHLRADPDPAGCDGDKPAWGRGLRPAHRGPSLAQGRDHGACATSVKL
jgi:hypothetical protein